MEKFQGHQGDVFFEQIELLPEDLVEITPKEGRIVLALGEVTGHAHAIYPVDGVLSARFFKSGDANFLQVEEKCFLRHEEHAPIPFEKGIYRIPNFKGGTQREYHPEEIKRVMD